MGVGRSKADSYVGSWSQARQAEGSAHYIHGWMGYAPNTFFVLHLQKMAQGSPDLIAGGERGSRLLSPSQLLASPCIAHGGAAWLEEASSEAAEEVLVGWGLPAGCLGASMPAPCPCLVL